MPTGTVARLRAAGCVYAEEEARLLEEAALQGGASDLDRLVAARAAGVPLEALLGWADFAGLRVAVDAGVFVPRRRTGLLVDLAEAAAPTGGTVVDLCCGSGAVLRALAHRRPDLVGHAADSDPRAVACARRNLPAERVHEGDLYDALPAALRGHVDVLVVNAPYVPTDEIARMPAEARDHEPRLALDGGPEGLDVLRRVAAAATTWLTDAGTLLVEAAPSQTTAAVTVLAAHGLAAEPVSDPERDATALRATGTARSPDRAPGVR